MEPRGDRTTRGGASLATDKARINGEIRARQVRLIGADGSQLGTKSLREARAIAAEVGLDLVEVAANAEPPVCKIMDFGKYKSELAERRRASTREPRRWWRRPRPPRPPHDDGGGTSVREPRRPIGPAPDSSEAVADE